MTYLDITIYDPLTVKPFDLSLKLQKTFLAVIDTNTQFSSLQLLLEAYLQQFSKDDSVSLVLFLKSLSWMTQALNPLLETLGYDDNQSPEIIVLDDLTDEQIPSLFSACHAYIHLSPGEGEIDNLNLLKALCMNCQLISFKNSWINHNLPLKYAYLCEDMSDLKQALLDMDNGERKEKGRDYYFSHFYRQAVPQNPTLQEVTDAFNKNHYQQAVALAKQFLKNDNLNFNALFKCMQIFVNTDHDQLAEEVFKKVKQVLKGIEEQFQIYLDPTQMVPYSQFISTKERADQVYKEAFRRCFEYLQGSRMKGCILEFGTYLGYTARLMASLIKELDYGGKLYLYDSFEGLPSVDSEVDKLSYEVAVHHVWEQGMLDVPAEVPTQIKKALNRIISPEQFSMTIGFFEDVLPQQLPTDKASLVHIDCDLYSSALFVLEQLLEHDLLHDGTLLIFDDFHCNHANPELGERKALREAFETQSRFSYSPFFSYGWHGQVFFVHDKEKFQGL